MSTASVVDGHHHIWRQADLLWLTGPMQPRIFGPYEPIRRDYPIEEFLEDIEGTGVEKSVYVQANWRPGWFENEVAWVQATADRTGWPHAIVGYADFLQDDVGADLKKLEKYPLMRGIRQQLHWHENQMYRFASSPDLPSNPTMQKNVARLAEHGWCFELQVFASQMQSASDLAAACPDVTFILQHAGMLEDDTEAGRARWKDGMQRLAARPNVVCKLSGLGTFIHRNDVEHIQYITREAVACFGAERCLFGSNFPIEKLWCRYADLVDAYRRAVAGMSAAAQLAILNGTATRVYRL
ncbi:MAG: amidohydrolase family protein [Rhizobiales bacterium]|nr:amidohydrolase family protein [Hyphomicrobiales bacterium]